MRSKRMDFDLMQLVFEDDIRSILSLTVDSALSIKEIARRLDIPLSRCYRKVKEMLDSGVMSIDGTDENNALLYTSNLRSYSIVVGDSALSFLLEQEDGVIRSFEYCVGPGMMDA